MAVDTHKLGDTMFRGSQIKSAKYLKAGFHGHFKTESHLPVMAKAMADFITADTARGSFTVVEMKRNIKRASARQISSYLRMLSVIPEHSVEKRLERLEEEFNNLVSSTWNYLFSEGDIKEMRELSKGMLEGSKKMRELAEQLQEADDKC